jgi:hypothetical protein
VESFLRSEHDREDLGGVRLNKANDGSSRLRVKKISPLWVESFLRSEHDREDLGGVRLNKANDGSSRRRKKSRRPLGGVSFWIRPWQMTFFKQSSIQECITAIVRLNRT